MVADHYRFARIYLMAAAIPVLPYVSLGTSMLYKLNNKMLLVNIINQFKIEMHK
jgi:hypothetical protein